MGGGGGGGAGGGGAAWRQSGEQPSQVLALLEEYRVAAFYDLFNTPGAELSHLSHNLQHDVSVMG